MSGKVSSLIKQFIKFGIVGLTNTAISYGIYAGLLFLNCHYLVASIVSFILSVAWSFYWNNRMVFTLQEGENRVWWKALLKTYVAYGFTGLILNNVLLWVWIDLLGVNAYLAFFLNLLVSVPLNFIINRNWAFKGGAGKDTAGDAENAAAGDAEKCVAEKGADSAVASVVENAAAGTVEGDSEEDGGTSER